MRRFYRWMRKTLAAAFILVVAGGVVYYLVFTLTGIADEIRERAKINDRDALLVQTATALAPTIAQESLQLAGFGETLITDTPQPDSPVTDEAAPVLTATSPPVASDTPTETETATETVIPSDTPAPTETATEIATDTPIPSDTATSRPTATDLPPTEKPTTEVPSTEVSEAVVESPSPVVVTTESQLAQRATLIPTNTLRPTSIPTNTPRPTLTPSKTPTATFTPTDTLTPSQTPTATLTPTSTSTFTATPTATNTATPTATFTPSNTPTPTPSPYPIEGTYATPVVTPIVDFPPRAPLIEDDPNIINIVLLGSDSTGDSIGRNDVLILVNVNKNTGTAAMWHIPRDLLVYIPGYTVDRINRAYPIGFESDWPGGAAELVKETILYNFGIEVDFYARVNFTDFQQIIEQLGGLEISVDCQIRDWALISPDMDIYDENSYEQFTMGIGRQTLTPYYALWYARSRVTTSDLDRGRRQIDVLRAIFAQARQQGVLTQVTELFPQALEIVDTDMTLSDILGFIPMATTLELNNIERYNGVLGVHYENFTTPDDGRSVLIPHYDALYQLARDFETPPTENRVSRSGVSIEVWDASAYGIGFDLVSSDRLAWEGFNAVPMGQIPGVRKEVTTIYDYTGETKGSALERIMQVMRVGDSNVVVQPDPNRTVDYRIEVGTSYNSCLIGSSADELDLPTPPPDGESAQPADSPPIPTPPDDGEVQTVG